MHVIIWRYVVKPHHLQSFLAYYSPSGKWSDLFRKSKEYIATDLLSMESNNLIYLTIDKWTSELAYTQFIQANKSAYAELDKITEEFTIEEELVGTYLLLE